MKKRSEATPPTSQCVVKFNRRVGLTFIVAKSILLSSAFCVESLHMCMLPFIHCFWVGEHCGSEFEFVCHMCIWCQLALFEPVGHVLVHSAGCMDFYPDSFDRIRSGNNQFKAQFQPIEDPLELFLDRLIELLWLVFFCPMQLHKKYAKKTGETRIHHPQLVNESPGFSNFASRFQCVLCVVGT